MRGLQSKSFVSVAKLLSLYRPPEWTLAAVVLCSVTALVPVTSTAAECTCDQLSIVQLELRNAKRVQQNYRDHVATLGTMSHEASQRELRRFAGREAGAGWVNAATDGGSGVTVVPDGGSATVTRAIAFEAHGETIPERQHARHSNETLCAMSAQTREALDLEEAACDGIKKATRAHEESHAAMCLQLGYPRWKDRHGADIAMDEAHAYGVQVAVLRAVIARLLETADVRVLIGMDTHVRSPPGLPGGFNMPIDWIERGEIGANQVEMRGDVIRLDGQGIMTVNASTEGTCRFTTGLPYSVPISGGINTDGLTAQLRYTLNAGAPAFGLWCHLPWVGPPHESMTSATPESETTEFLTGDIPLRHGAQEVTDLATEPGAQLSTSMGISVTGQAKVSLLLQCRSVP